MPDTSTPLRLIDLSPAERQARRQQADIRRLLLRRLPLMTHESLLQRLAGLRRHHPASAAVAAALSRRAAAIRVTGDLELARALEAEYCQHLAAQGLVETWYDRRADEAVLLDRHLERVSQALARDPAAPPRLHPAEER